MPFSHSKDVTEERRDTAGAPYTDEVLRLKQIYEQTGIRARQICQDIKARGRQRVQLLKDRNKGGEERALPDEMLKFLEESVEDREKFMETTLEIIGAEPKTIIRKGRTEVPISDISVRISSLRVLKSVLDAYCSLLRITDIDIAQEIKQLITYLKKVKRSKQGSGSG